MDKKVVVIGAGFGGLSAAALLAKEGHDVTLIEKNWDVGGRGMQFKENGYTFDMGPSWYLMPEAFDNFFEEMGTSTEKELDLIRLDPAYRVFFSDETIDIRKDLDKNLETFEKLEPGVTDTFMEYLDKAEMKYEISLDEVLYKDYKKYTDFFTMRLLKEGLKLDILTNMDSYLKKKFKSKKLRQILLYTVVFLGSVPKKTPGVYSLMSHADFNLGVYYPKGGMNGVAKAMAEVGKRHGLKIKLNTPVEKIVTKDGKVRGVQTEDEFIKADIVVGNADYHHVETQLLEKEDRSYKEKYWKKKTMAPSALLLYLGVDKKIPELDHHNLIFKDDWEAHFETVFNKKEWPKDFHLYVCKPTQTEPEMAPEGKENLFALLPLAPGLEDDKETIEEYTDKIIALIEEVTGNKFKDDIEYQKAFGPSDFKDTFNAYKGTALGLAHTMMQTAVLRPKHRSKKVKNLYYTGHYTHPGIGVPMVIISGHIVRDIIKNDK